ncbi:MAG: hypothetical protein F6K56_01085 [Moorea sp. SIO3G5]|nr:hypothetical protein [Moorena sp. SIO3G5]
MVGCVRDGRALILSIASVRTSRPVTHHPIKLRLSTKFSYSTFYPNEAHIFFSSCLLPLASCLLPLASCLLPLAFCLLSVPCSLFPVP